MSLEKNNKDKLSSSQNSSRVDSLLRHRFLVIILFQFFSVVIAYAGAFYARLDFNIPRREFEIFYKTLPLLLIARTGSYYYYKIHSGSWRFVSMRDLVDTCKAAFTGSVIFLISVVFVYNFPDFPRSVFILEAVFSLVVIGGARFLIRYHYELQAKEKGKAKGKTLKYVLIAGAGKAGVLLLNEVKTNSMLGIHVVGFVDDNPYKTGTNIQGIPIPGRSEDIPEIARKHNVDEVVIAIPSASYQDIVRIKKIAVSANVTTKVLPGLGKLMQEDTFIGQLKDVDCDDLLGRKVLKFCRESDHRLMEEEIGEKGLRPGEKLHEELYWQGEGIVPTENKKITMLRPNSEGCENLFKKIKLLEESVAKDDVREVQAAQRNRA